MKKKYIITTVLLTVCLLVSLVLNIHLLGDRNTTTHMEKNTPKKVSYFIDDWYQEHRIITHALGGIEGKTCTNSLDALDVNYQKGKRVFEADFNYSADHQVVLTHDFQETTNDLIDFPIGYIPSYDEFMANKVYYKYRPGNAKELLHYMDTHQDMYLVSDIKYEDPSTITSILSDLVALAKSEQIEHVLDRLIVQFYFEQNYYDIQSIYPFKNYIYSLYAEKNKDFEGVKNFCVANDIPVVLMRSSWVKDELSLLPFVEHDIKVYVYTLNNLTRIYERQAQGVYGFVSDYAQDSDLTIKWRHEQQKKIPLIYRYLLDIGSDPLYD